MDTRLINLVASYEKIMDVPTKQKTTGYFGDLCSYYIRSEEAMERARGIRDKALDLLGMTKDEFNSKPDLRHFNEIKIAIEDSMKSFKNIYGCKDSKYLFENLSHDELSRVESILKANGKEIHLDIPRYPKTQEIDFDGEFNLVVDGKVDFSTSGIENQNYIIDVLKWYDGLTDTGYMVDSVHIAMDREQKMKALFMDRRFEIVEIFNKPVLFDCLRIKKDEVPDGLYKYDIRHDDDCQGDMVQLKDYVLVNHWGTVISKEPFDITQEINGNNYTTNEGIGMSIEDYNYTGENISVRDYIDSYDELVKKYTQDIRKLDC